MGLERIAAVLQGTHDNYETDLFRALDRAPSSTSTGVPAEGKAKASNRVIADHLRASSFLIADGVLPSNEGRGYVLRRIMRRAMRHAELLGARDPLMYKLVPTLVREMGAAYPELVRAQPMITETLLLEENRFRKTLERGLRILDEEFGQAARWRHILGRDRLQALRHLWLSARPDPGCAQAARHQGRYSRPSMRRWRPSAKTRAKPGRARARPRPKLSGSSCASASAPPNSSAMTPKRAEGIVRAHGGRRQGGRSAGCRDRPARWSSTRRRSMASPAARPATMA